MFLHSELINGHVYTFGSLDGGTLSSLAVGTLVPPDGDAHGLTASGTFALGRTMVKGNTKPYNEILYQRALITMMIVIKEVPFQYNHTITVFGVHTQFLILSIIPIK